MAQMIAVCGLDCGERDIRQAKDDSAIAQHIVEWFKEELAVDVKPEDLRCGWCKGNRAEHWSPDCWILKCCLDDKGLESCYQCEVFPCQELNEWSQGSLRYGDALERLKRMK